MNQNKLMCDKCKKEMEEYDWGNIEVNYDTCWQPVWFICPGCERTVKAIAVYEFTGYEIEEGEE